MSDFKLKASSTQTAQPNQTSTEVKGLNSGLATAIYNKIATDAAMAKRAESNIQDVWYNVGFLKTPESEDVKVTDEKNIGKLVGMHFVFWCNQLAQTYSRENISKPSADFSDALVYTKALFFSDALTAGEIKRVDPNAIIAYIRPVAAKTEEPKERKPVNTEGLLF